MTNPLPPVQTAVLYYRWLAAGLRDKIISQGVRGHRVYVGICHPERMGPLAPAIHVLWETAEKTWQRCFALFVAVKHCGRFMIKGNRFYTSQATER